MSRFALMPEQASTMAGQVDAVYLALIAVTIVFSVLIAGLLIRFMVVYRRRSATYVPPLVHVPIWLEILWSAVPLGITMVAFLWGAQIFAALVEPPPDSLEVFVVGRQWMWKIQHLEGRREIDELHVPIGRPVKLIMTSEDVIHSFYVPAFRVKMDAVPGRYSTVWFEATKPGTYHLFCAEYCGTLHSGMIGRVVAMEPAEFQAWLTGPAQTGTANVSVTEQGAQLFQSLGCVSCHRAGEMKRGPQLEGLFGRTVHLAGGGTAVADERYIRDSILDSSAKVVEGYQPLMPTYRGLLNEEQVLQLIAYIKGLGPEAGS
jgi:cytochrome c oxidase subunit 2